MSVNHSLANFSDSGPVPISDTKPVHLLELAEALLFLVEAMAGLSVEGFPGAHVRRHVTNAGDLIIMLEIAKLKL